jgi:imidazolonepropionase-like amidohydrolase
MSTDTIINRSPLVDRHLSIANTTMRLLLILLLLIVVGLPDASAQIAVRGGTVHTVSGPSISDGVVLIEGSQITAVGPVSEIEIPAGYRTIDAAVVIPGLIDAHATVGLSGIYNQPHEQDQLDRSGPIQPELRAIDAYNPREELVAWLNSLGITTVHTGHAPGAPISGQTMIVRTAGETVDAVTIRPAAMVAATLGPGIGRNFDSPGTRSKNIAMLRQALIRAQEYQQKRESGGTEDAPGRDLQLETLTSVLRGEMPLLVTAQRATEIVTAIRLASEFGFRLVLDGAAEAYLVLDEIRDAGVPVILHPTMVRAGGEMANASFETASRLREAGIPFAFQSGYEAYVPKTRVVLFEAGLAAANGLGFDAALYAATLGAASLLGIDDRIGSIEVGKDADLALFDGDPFEYTSRACTVIVSGQVTHDECR